ncbi:hypothetical protein FRB99_000150 [Tulasnella sp. 403]|nr:hypothetical protein FRB99_000150 [Tulasnella sp. 403]
MRLADLPADIFVEIVKRLKVHDILALRQVSRRLESLSRLRTVWFNALDLACTQHGIPRYPPVYFQLYDDDALERLACRPSRFRTILTSFANDPPNNIPQEACSDRSSNNLDARFPARTTPPPILRPAYEYTLPGDDYAKAHLVKGGRWLVTLSDEGVLRVWDVEPCYRRKPEQTVPPVGGPSISKSIDSNAYPNNSDHSGHVLHAERCFPPNSRLMDAFLSSEDHMLHVFIQTYIKTDMLKPQANVLSVKTAATPLDPTDPDHFVTVASWQHPEWTGDLNCDICFSEDLVIFASRSVQEHTWIWNWRLNASKRIRLQAPSGTDSLLRSKIVLNYLLVVHGQDGRKCYISMYALPALDLELLAQASVGSPSHDRAQLPSSSDSTALPGGSSPPSEIVHPIFTSPFESLRHVQKFYRPRSKAPASTEAKEGEASGSTSRSTTGATSSGRSSSGSSSASKIYVTPFRIGTVVITGPFWLVPPQSHWRGLLGWNRGEFRVAIAIESTGDPTMRTRLQYLLEVDLDAVANSVRGLQPSGPSEDTSTPAGEREIETMRAKPAPELRGRVTQDVQGIYFQDRLSVGFAEQVVMSLWCSPYGIHAHISHIPKRESKKPKKGRAETPEGRRRQTGPISVRIRDQNQQGVLKRLAAEGFPQVGIDAIIYRWTREQRLPWEDNRPNFPARTRGMHAHRSSVPSTLQPPSVVQQPPSNNAPNSLTHALSLPPPRPPDTQQQQQFIQPQAIYHNPPQVPPPTSSPYTHPFPPPAQPPQQQPQSTQPADGTTDETLPIKRKRGRPKGSKTKNRRVDGVLVPLHALGAAAASSTGTTANTTTVPAPAVQGGGDATAADHGDDDDEHDHADESMDVESPVAPDFALQPSSSSVAVVSSGLPPGTSDGAALGLGIGLDVPGPSSSTRAGMSSDIRATSHPAPASSSVGVGAPSTGAATSPTSTTTIKDFYDFQWRVISLCSVFYESAGDLVRATDPAVLAQSFQLGSRADPMTLLHHAKEFCDFFLANPERLARGPLPPPIPTSLFPTSSAPPSQPVPTPPITTYPVPSRPDIHPGPSSSSFGQRRPSQQFYPTPISPTASSSNPYLASIYNRPPVSAPTSTTPATHSPQQPQQPKQTASSLSGAVPITPSHPPVLPPHISITNNPYLPANTLAQTHPIPPPTYVAPVSASAAKSIPQSTHGAWSDEETERLKTLAEQSRSRTHNGDIDWDWTVDMFGETRTRHQILIKATNLGLKQTSTHPSRLRKRLSMTNTQDGSPSVPPASSTTPVSHQVETIRETMLGGSGGSRSSQGSNPSPPVGASATSMQHPQSQAPGTSQQAPGMSPSASMTSTPTLPHSDQHPHQVQHLPPPHAPPGHHRRPSSSASFQPSPAMGTSTALRPSQGVLASPTPGQAQGPGPQGYMQPPPHPTGRTIDAAAAIILARYTEADVPSVDAEIFDVTPGAAAASVGFT